MGPISVLAEAIRDSARAVDRARGTTTRSREVDASLIALMALLFAVARLIAGRLADSSLEDLKDPGAFASLEQGIEALAALAPDTERATLYEYSIRLLLAFERELKTHWHHALGRAPVQLPVLEHGGDILISGIVHLWLRPLSQLRELRRERRKKFPGTRGPDEQSPSGEERPPEPRPHLPMGLRLNPERQLTILGAYWQANPELPPARPQNSRDRTLDDHILVTDSGGLARDGSFRVALCPLAGDFHPHFEIGAAGGTFRIHRPDPMAASESLERHLDLLLEAADRQRIDLLLLPELTVDETRRERLITGLRDRGKEYPRAIVPGSFHFWSDGGDRPINETRLLDGLGDELLSHRKAGRFRMIPEIVRSAPHFFCRCEYVRAGGALSDEIYEDIDRTAALQFLDTSLGRLATVVCADGIDSEENTLFDSVRTVRPDLLLIVSMSAKTGRFEELAMELARLEIGTLMVNAACVAVGEPPPMLAIADLALPDMPGLPSTRLRWPAMDAKPEVYRRHRDIWEPAEPGTDAAIAWLSAGDQRLGLILDLNPHFRIGGTQKA